MALLGWSPKGDLAEQEIFTLDQLVDAFELSPACPSPPLSLTLRSSLHFNALYLRAMAPEEFAKVAEPYIRQAVKDPSWTRPRSPTCSRPGARSSPTSRRRWTSSTPCPTMM